MKKFSKILFAVLVLTLVLVGCKTAQKVDKPDFKIEAHDMEFTAVRADDYTLIVSYPEDIYQVDAEDFIAYLVAKYPEQLYSLQYGIHEGGLLIVNFPYKFTKSEVSKFARLVEAELDDYIPQRVREVEEEHIEQAKAELKALETAARLEEEAARKEAEAIAAREAALKAQAEAEAAAKAAAEAAAKAAAEKEAADKAAAEAAAKAAADKAAAEAAAKAAAEKAAAEAAAKEKEAQEAAAKAAAAKEAEAAAKKSHTGTIILIIVLVLLAAACAYYFLIFRKKNTK